MNNHDLYDRIVEHLQGAGLNMQYSIALAKKVCSWNNALGSERTVKVLKELKSLFTSQFSTAGSCFDQLVELEWEINNEVACLKDTFLNYLVFSFGLDHPEKFRAVVDVQYMFTLTNVTTAGKKKFLDAVMTEPKELSTELLLYTTVAVDWFKEYAFKKNPGSWTMSESCITLNELDYSSQYQKYLMMMTTSKRSPVFQTNFRMKSTVRSSMRTLEWLPLWTHDRDLYNLWSNHELKVNSLLLGTNATGIIPPLDVTTTAPMGTIAVILEKGNKERWICNPHASLQMVTEPIKSVLLDVSSQVPWVYTTNQDKAHAHLCWLHRKGLGETMHCFDASSFTDTFSFDLQLHVVRRLFHRNDWPYVEDALTLLARKSYYSDNHKCDVTWKSGQPLGTGPSFHLACLAHAIVQMAASIKLTVTEKNYQFDPVSLELLDSEGNPLKLSTIKHLKKNIIHQTTLRFGVVGDDGFCYGDEYAEGYLKFLVDANLQINHDKSIVSDSLYEFCGKWIINGQLIKSTKPPRVYEKAAQVLSAIADYGLQYYLSLRDNVVKQFDLRRSIQLPKKLGGLDMSYPELGSAMSLDIGKLLKLKEIENVTFVHVPITMQSYGTSVKVDQRSRTFKIALFLKRCVRYFDVNDISKVHKIDASRQYQTEQVTVCYSEWSKLPVLTHQGDTADGEQLSNRETKYTAKLRAHSEGNKNWKNLKKFHTNSRISPSMFRLKDQMYRFSKQINANEISSLIADGEAVTQIRARRIKGYRPNTFHYNALSLDKRSPFEEITHAKRSKAGSGQAGEIETGPSRYFRQKVETSETENRI